MADQTPGSASAPLPLPDAPNLDWLRKQAKRRLAELRKTNPAAKLADAQLDLARRYGFTSWRALKAHIDARAIEGQLFQAVKAGDAEVVARLLDAHPDRLHARTPPYEHTLLHAAAQAGHLPIVDLLLARGIDPNVKEKGDDTYPMHWAAAGGHLDVVRRLADAGGDVVGHGDDHELEVIGWATCWDGGDDEAHRRVADFLVARGARHHIFSAIALNLADEVRRIVAGDPSALTRRMSRNEDHQLPLHFAVRMRRPEMVKLLIELGADPLGVDQKGFIAAAEASSTAVDGPIMEAIRDMTSRELRSAERGRRAPNLKSSDLMAAIALREWELAERLFALQPKLASDGLIHIMAKRGDAAAVKWLLDRGVDANARTFHWEVEVAPLHLAAWGGSAEVIQLLLDAGADPSIRDSKFESDAAGWAEHFGHSDIARHLRDHTAGRPA